MAVKECSLYKFIVGGRTVSTTPVDLKARKLSARVSSVINHGATKTLTIDLSVNRLLALGHPNTASLRGLYIINTNGVVGVVIPAADMTVSCTVSSGVGILTIKSTTTSSSNAAAVVI